MRTIQCPQWITVSNARLWRALFVVRLCGRSPETMAEVFDALKYRRDWRADAKWEAEQIHLEVMRQIRMGV
jgi:hypothetical protein